MRIWGFVGTWFIASFGIRLHTTSLHHNITKMKIILTIFGLLSLTLGVIGIFVPILPTTPLLLLAAWCFFRSSKTLYEKLINSKHLGSYIKNFRENKIIPLKTKVYIITLLWASLIYCIFFVASGMLWLQILLAIILIGVTMHILSYKS